MRSLKKTNLSNTKACELLGDDFARYNIDIGVITETFLSKRIPDTYVWINGYSIQRRDRKTCNCRKASCSNAHGGGGILIYFRSSMHGDLYSVSPETESMWIKLQVSNSCNPIFVNASYAPPNAPVSYISALREYIIHEAEEILAMWPNAVMYIAGDFNRMNLDEIELSCGVSSLPSPPTRGDAQLDVVLTNKPHLFESVSCFDSKVNTDHRAVLVSPLKKHKPERRPQFFRLMNSFGHKKFELLLSNEKFAEELYGLDVESAAETLEENILSCFMESFPLRRVVMSSRDPSWITPKIKWLLTKKKSAKRKRHLRKAKKIDDRIKEAKIRSLSRTDMKVWWNEMDSINHRKHNKKSINYNNFKPQVLNQQLAQRCEMTDACSVRTAPIFDTQGESPPEISMSEVCHILKTCKRTSPGLNGIPSFVYQKYWKWLAPHYLFVWNLSLKVGNFPRCYKTADIIPLPKIRNPKNAKDIRGISITPIAARLFERAVHRRWISDGILYRGDVNQFAYKKGLSTIDYLLCLQHFILNNLDDRSVDGVHVIAADFSMAFERVNQEIAAMSYAKFTDSQFVARWLYDFTIGRKQRLVWRDTPCDYLPIERGCSQGTVGGPSIFSIFTDDIRARDTSSVILKYSDDMCCASPCLKEPSDLEKCTFYDEVEHFCSLAEEKGLCLNKDKTKHIRFCLNNVPYCKCVPKLSTCSTVSEMKILGVTFQENCSFSKHCTLLLCHLRSLLYLFKDLKLKSVSLKEISRCFDAIVVSRIRYGISVYGSDAGALKKIDAFLERCYAKGYCAERIFVEELLKTEDQRLLKNILCNVKHPLRDYLLSRKKDRTTRHGFWGTKPKTRTKIFSNSFCNRIL